MLPSTACLCRPQQHLKDTGIDRLRSIVRQQTDDGLKIVRFLVKAMDGDLSGYEPHSQTRNASPPLALKSTT